MAVSCKICNSTLHLSSTWPSGASAPQRNAKLLIVLPAKEPVLATFHPASALPCRTPPESPSHPAHTDSLSVLRWKTHRKQANWTSLSKIHHRIQQARGLSCCLATGAPISLRHQQLPWQRFFTFSQPKVLLSSLPLLYFASKHHPRFLLLSLCSFMAPLSVSFYVTSARHGSFPVSVHPDASLPLYVLLTACGLNQVWAVSQVQDV